MAIVENDGILSAEEYKAFKSRSINLKFMYQFFGAVGGATFFGLFVEIAKPIMHGALAAISPWAIPLAIAGAICIYVAQHYYFESTTLDQDFQAKKIGIAASRAQSVNIAQTPDGPVKQNGMPPGMAIHANEQRDHAEHAHPEKRWADAVPQRLHAEHAPRQKADNWAQEVRLNEAGTQASKSVH